MLYKVVHHILAYDNIADVHRNKTKPFHRTLATRKSLAGALIHPVDSWKLQMVGGST